MNRPALDRLLGGDSELEIELRQQIADQFADKHLRSLLNNKVFNQWRKTLSTEVDSAIQESLAKTTKQGWRRTVTLNGDIRERIHEAVQEAAEEAIKKEVDNVVAKVATNYEKRAEERFARIERRVAGQVAEAVSEAKLDKLIDLGVQRRLDMAASFGQSEREPRVVDLT